MLETSARLLRLLSLLQAHRDWSGAALAERLGVTTRTVRRDVDRLRELGYPVQALQGRAGYRLGAGAALPPLLLDDDEAVAVVVGLRTASAGSVAGIEETSLRALAKLEAVLPSRLRDRVQTLARATVRTGTAPGPQVSADALVVIADACRRSERLRLDYTTATGAESRRTVEPHRLVNFGRHWYLVAWDLDRQDWRSFRVDRIVPRPPTGPRVPPRDPPDGDVAAYLARQLSARAWPRRATIQVSEPADAVSARIWPGMGVVTPVDERTCSVHLGADTAAGLVWMITSLDADFRLIEGPPELAAAFRDQARRCREAVGG
ncbi:helix-turn-helix transcriptional regulator [Blastococcus xanthinilyticus]|uniref:Putative DNA-binding transcriptional regulator YafY n=1 Tax=Blastococcus xanthinilyticus TaxID=1564164 RepID=A0A5S5CV98_9ACTN|nr:YafY family protein [Blastococcus xanthinilyticus]TYP86249.1 putative DNA-binding transcriptional regulator YafY [Blastococcus xanthinilyticus]